MHQKQNYQINEIDSVA